MKLSESTTISLSMLWTLGAAGIGGIMWLTTIFVQGNATAGEVKELKSEMRVLHEIDKRLERIELKLQIKR